MKRPVYFTDWTKLYWYEVKLLGHTVYHRLLRSQGTLKVNREIWERLHRINRIQARIDLEHKVMDKTWVDRLLRLVFDKHN